jgi:hypothetical protein
VPAIDRLFRAHPQTVGESYAEHGLFALRFAARLLVAGGAALIHAAIPCLCETTASRMVLDMHAEIVARRARAVRPHAPAGALQVR